MNIIPATGSGPVGAWRPASRASGTTASATRVEVPATPFEATSTGQRSDTYADPRATTTSRAISSLWAVPARSGDTISTLMAGNRSSRVYNLAEQWRGLGGALLRHLGATGEGYSQTRVNDPAASDDPAMLARLSPEMQARHADEIASARAVALADAGKDASTAELQLRLQSGRTVTLSLADSAGFGPIGMQVSIAASGALSPQERGAVQALAEGLDRALAGLGQPDVAKLDLGGLLAYDRQVIAGLDLTVHSATKGQYLEAFELHMGGDKPSVYLKGIEGEMRLSVDARTAPAGGSAASRAEALRGLLSRISSAGERGQANPALVEQMKSALVQLQAASASASTSPAPAPTGVGRPGTGGVADFEASFSGNTWRPNAAGTTRQGGEVAYQLNQKTEGDGRGGLRQTQSESLSADFKASPDGGMLNVDTGNYTATQVRDRSTVTTLLESIAGGGIRALRQTDAENDRTVTVYEGGKVVRQQRAPLQRHDVQLLG